MCARSLILLFLTITTSRSSFAQQEQTTYVPAAVGFFNVENLFDTIDQPDTDDAEYLPDSPKQWGTYRYTRKIEKMAGVIASMATDVHPQGVAILGLCEVENRAVVEDLVAAAPIRERGYQVVHTDSRDRRGVDVALIHDPLRFQVYAHKAYRLHMPDTAFRTRDQLLVSGVLDGDTTHVIVNHWPSRRGGQKRSAPHRRAAADLGRQIVDSLLAIDPDAYILYMGDLNDDPVDASVIKHLRATGNGQAVEGGNLFNPMSPLFQKGIGSLAWRDSWSLFVQLIISPGLYHGRGGRYKYYGARVFNEPHLRQKEGNFAGYPSRTFVGDTYQDGYSDHFPVYLILVREE